MRLADTVPVPFPAKEGIFTAQYTFAQGKYHFAAPPYRVRIYEFRGYIKLIIKLMWLKTS